MTETTPLNIDEYLTSEQDIKDFLADMAENGTPEEFIHALSIAAKAKGMTNIAQKAGVTRASLYKSLSEKGNPNFKTIHQVVQALGFKLIVT